MDVFEEHNDENEEDTEEEDTDNEDEGEGESELYSVVNLVMEYCTPRKWPVEFYWKLFCLILP